MTSTSLPVIKHVPEDFVVTEIPAEAPCPSAPYLLVELTKRGMTTLEAIEEVAARLDVASTSIGHAGMKDEDAVTTQCLTVPAEVASNLDGPITVGGQTGAWAEVRAVGYAREPLRPGRLLGNAFSILVRNLSPQDSARLVDVASRGDLAFVNYYDTQRFGVPGGPRTTHLIGLALECGDHREALDLLTRSATREAAAARHHEGDPALFFDVLDGRTTAFYRSAAESSRWNETVAALQDEHVATRREGLPYLVPLSSEAALRAASRGGLSHTYRRWTHRDGVLQGEDVPRPTVVVTRVRADLPGEDEHFAGRTAVRLGFMLPSGCYATMALHHLLTYAGISERPPDAHSHLEERP